MFKKRNWSKWVHVCFVEKFTSGIPTYQILVREDTDTGLKQYKMVFVASCVHNLSRTLIEENK